MLGHESVLVEKLVETHIPTPLSMKKIKSCIFIYLSDNIVKSFL
jgi:hypothetical protein